MCQPTEVQPWHRPGTVPVLDDAERWVRNQTMEASDSGKRLPGTAASSTTPLWMTARHAPAGR